MTNIFSSFFTLYTIFRSKCTLSTTGVCNSIIPSKPARIFFCNENAPFLKQVHTEIKTQNPDIRRLYRCESILFVTYVENPS